MYSEQKLTYGFSSLEPYIDTHTLGLHHERHYLSYLSKLNMLLEKNGFDLKIPKEELPLYLDQFPDKDRADLLFNLGGVINHELYFSMLSGEKNNKPSGRLLSLIEKKYGTYQNFKDEFKKEALRLKGSGYTYLVMDATKQLYIVSLSNQDMPFLHDLYPLIVLDMWEHAYYLNDQNRKDDYIDDFFTILNYKEIEKRIS